MLLKFALFFAISLTTAAARPNVLFISLDDLNDWVGCLGGHPQAKTPNLDRLAASGMLFDNAHCPAPACNPSRTAIMTGLAPNRSGMYSNRQKMREVLPDAELLPKILLAPRLLVGRIGQAAALLYRRAFMGRILPAEGGRRSLPPAHAVGQAAEVAAAGRSVAVRGDRLARLRRHRRRIRRRLEGGGLRGREAFCGARQTLLPRLRYLPPTRAMVCSEKVLRFVPDRRGAVAARLQSGRSRRPARGGQEGRSQPLLCAYSRAGPVEAGRAGLPGVDRLRRCHAWPRARCAGRRAEQRQHHRCVVERPRLAPRRETALAKIHRVARGDPRAAHRSACPVGIPASARGR